MQTRHHKFSRFVALLFFLVCQPCSQANSVRDIVLQAKAKYDALYQRAEKINPYYAKQRSRELTASNTLVVEQRAEICPSKGEETIIFTFHFAVTGIGCKVKVFSSATGQEFFSADLPDYSGCLTADLTNESPGQEIVIWYHLPSPDRAHLTDKRYCFEVFRWVEWENIPGALQSYQRCWQYTTPKAYQLGDSQGQSVGNRLLEDFAAAWGKEKAQNARTNKIVSTPREAVMIYARQYRDDEAMRFNMEVGKQTVRWSERVVKKNAVVLVTMTDKTQEQEQCALCWKSPKLGWRVIATAGMITRRQAKECGLSAKDIHAIDWIFDDEYESMR